MCVLFVQLGNGTGGERKMFGYCIEIMSYDGDVTIPNLIRFYLFNYIITEEDAKLNWDDDIKNTRDTYTDMYNKLRKKYIDMADDKDTIDYTKFGKYAATKQAKTYVMREEYQEYEKAQKAYEKAQKAYEKAEAEANDVKAEEAERNYAEAKANAEANAADAAYTAWKGAYKDADAENKIGELDDVNTMRKNKEIAEREWLDAASSQAADEGQKADAMIKAQKAYNKAEKDENENNELKQTIMNDKTAAKKMMDNVAAAAKAAAAAEKAKLEAKKGGKKSRKSRRKRPSSRRRKNHKKRATRRRR
jgi:hypothetical protein